MHLLNWIEDLYIEDKLVQDYPFLKDIVHCLKLITVPYDILDIDKAFNHFYIKGHASPTLAAQDAYYFTSTIKQLLSLRSSNNFGKGPITLLSARSKETQFIKLIIEFYNWCVAHNIFDASQTLPPLSNPNMVLNNGGNTGSTSQQQQIDPNNSPDQGGSYSDHSHMVGGMYESVPKFDPQETAIFSEKFVAEQKLIKDELAKQYRIESVETSLDGLFNSLFKDSSIIQPKVIVQNFFNPNRLIDQVLFKAPQKSFNNVSIYRDISGSTHGHIFKLINNICKYLDDKIPVAYNFYLYASGAISILQTTFEDWDDMNNVPDVYYNDPTYQQLGGGTNSSAIADVMSEQLNDKWLNIIVTDGDLYDLMSRDNIEALLDNVFVISVESNSSIAEHCPHHIIVTEESEIPNIATALLGMKGV